MKRDDHLDPELADISLFMKPPEESETSLLSSAAKWAAVAAGGLAIGWARSVYPVLSLVPLPGQSPKEAPPHFSIRKLREGGKHAVIVINGFLSKGDLDTRDWEQAIGRKFGRATWYHLDWEAYQDPLKQLGDILTLEAWRKKSGKSEPPAALAWHSAMNAAEQAGELLARAILCTPGWRFTLVGHSLGARVIHYALKALAKHPDKRVSNAYLLGGAVGGSAKDNACWEAAVSAVSGRIFNCYSSEDLTLQGAYQTANVMYSRPAGYAGIHLEHPRIVDFNCSALVGGHMKWKSSFREILAQLEGY
jgi:pimeloyl-ACP methyl ester carboxylesterase